MWLFASGNVVVHGHPGEHDSGLLVIADLPSVDSFARYLRTYGYEPRWSQKKMPSVIKTCELSRFEFCRFDLQRGRLLFLHSLDPKQSYDMNGRGKVRLSLASARKSDREDRLAIIGSRFRDPSMTFGDLADYIQAQTQTRMTQTDRGPL